MEVIIVAIWDKNPDKVLTRPYVVSTRSKELKLDGRKPNKLIVPESVTDKVLLRKIKKIGSYDCKIIKAKGK